ncbi:MAG: hypothetical protein KatS3mg126_2303 [Lysobacteraceae bacterium]|nr:MAG: hypothetical protein KatS3mg126_2303 [Xanthomonadaceae bacterium]
MIEAGSWGRRGSRHPARRPDRTWQALRLLAAGVAVGLHLGLLAYWERISRWVPDAAETRLEVVFVPALRPDEAGVPPLPVPPPRPIRKVASPRPTTAPGAAIQAVEIAERSGQTEAARGGPPPPALRIFRADGGLRLPGSTDEVPVFDARARIQQDRAVRLPGHSDAAAAEAVALRLRRALTPEDVVLAVLRLLGGGPQPDDCPKIEARLLASDPGVSREIDLHKFREYCR